MIDFISFYYYYLGSENANFTLYIIFQPKI